MDIDSLTQQFRQKGEKILFELKQEVSGSGGTFDDTQVNRFLEDVKDPHIQIAVIGEIKTGNLRC